MQAHRSWIVFFLVVLAATREPTHAHAGLKGQAAPGAEERQFRAAEELRRQGAYPRAAQVYRRLLTDFPDGAHRRQAIESLYAIALYWLQDTFEQIRQV